ncbi:uncharacterized protein ARMOST_22609 [Armillaria ostoyae]|uniref:Uncharacterized protein n=1 Tax=Armillaria ostoyae TaxID=47428 RepID=A0A284SDB8_ARMOS|nr:uncharacterized protein ARMOST_22604 [Armillaria ostoyae]SJL19002.1 uncharacterized protein ARMOST_22607 [Armillaria ostoyae]SJL19004.1 uncharacterized protein ARMOST_22609 [Armillaria ostoyae]
MNAWLPQASYPCGTITPLLTRVNNLEAPGWLGLSSSSLISEGTDHHLVVELHP